MTNVIIIHGTGGSPESHWFPWLKTELEKLSCKVFVPKFPTPEAQSLSAWLSVFKKYEQYLDENAILVGHSVGSAFLLSVIENTPPDDDQSNTLFSFLHFSVYLMIHDSMSQIKHLPPVRLTGRK